jgi:hypothetical protein
MTPDERWRDAIPWAAYADDYGVDCPICSATITGELSPLGEMIDAVQTHIREAHPIVIDGEVAP